MKPRPRSAEVGIRRDGVSTPLCLALFAVVRVVPLVTIATFKSSKYPGDPL